MTESIQGLRDNRFVQWIASMKLTLVLVAVFAVTIATATFVETRYGSEGARALVYNAPWFNALLALLTVNLIVSLFANMPYYRPQTGFVITHTAFIIVLIGAAMTRFLGYEGMMHIREGSSSNYLMSSRDYIQISTDSDTASFPVRFYRPGAVSMDKTIRLADAKLHVSVEEYWSHLEMGIAEGANGEPAIAFATARRKGTLRLGESFREDAVTVRLRTQQSENPPSASRFGDLLIKLDGQTYRMPVVADPQSVMKAGGYGFRITEFAPNFLVGRESSVSDPMKNPAVRIEIEGPDGRKASRLLFAFHPEFNAAHATTQEEFPKIGLSYEYGRNLDLFLDGSGQLSGRANFEIRVASAGDHAAASTVEANTVFSVQPGTMLRGDGFFLVVKEFIASAVETAVSSDDEDAPPGVRIRVADGRGGSAEGVVAKWNEGVPLTIGTKQVSVTFGPERIVLPYRLQLDDFVLRTYPGSNNPASFESQVRIFDKQRGVTGRPVRIYMNHPLTYRGFKHFQSSYDKDRRGTILSVNYDPGKWPTYVGYFLVGLGFLITLTRGLLWNRPAKL